MTRLHTYALIKALFDQSKDYFDALCPLVLGVLEEQAFSDLTTIQERLKAKHGIDVPLYVIKTACGRAKIRGFAEQENNARSFKIVQAGRDYLNTLEPAADVQRRTNAFLTSLIAFFGSKGTTLTQQEAQKIVEAFIQDNLDGVIDFINPKLSTEARDNTLDRKDGALIVEFVQEIQHSKPEEYREFTELVLGSILASLLAAESSATIVEAGERKIKRAEIFFDTNIMFSLIGYHGDESNTAAKELFELLKSFNFPLKVFDFTVDEMCRVVNGYISNRHRFPRELPVDHIYSVLRKMNWGASDVSDFIGNVEDKIEALGIEIQTTDVNLADYHSPNNEALRSRIAATKPNDNRGLSTSHDLAAVDKIRDLRKRSVRRIEDADAFFLTSDFGLQRVILFGLGHQDSGTLSEVVLDRVLANILWLKNPSLNLPLTTIIATHSRDLLIDRRIWDKFYSVLAKLRAEGTVTEGQIENLFYHNNIANLLHEFSKTDVGRVNDNFVMEAVEEATKALSDKEQAELAARASIEKELFEVQTDQDEQAQEHNARLIDVKTGLRREARDRAVWLVTIPLIILLLLVLWGEVVVFLWLLQNLSQNYLTLLTTVYSGIGLATVTGTCTLVWFLRKRLISRAQEFLYHRLLKAVKLEDN